MFLSLKSALNGHRVYYVTISLLDEYPAEAAYSLRVLSSSFANAAVVRVRRDLDNAELDFTAAEVSDGTLLTWVGTGGTDNGFVETWYDQSGNVNNATQPTANNQPKIVENGALVVDPDTANPSILWDGTSDTMPISVVNGIKTIVTVSKLNVSGNKQIIGNGVSSFLRKNGPLWENTVSASFGFYGTFYTNGVVSRGGTSTELTFVTDDNTLPRNYNVISDSAFSRFWPGNISEMIIYTSDQTVNRLAIETNINDVYEIY